ncbi:BTAD domain-containing putative transcriptional regulator [Thermoactinospora rubra]|uniref:BTAD domain-containing putative transcriptional regulator n=1 Tax=Thermoactinospora rubra TaxID=1088767 RepID=UPI001301EBB8|nr:BTAD domain-containing putative transcriptional regulator [Thermoactinospora rubra]
MVFFGVLGPVIAVDADGRPVQLHSAKQRRLLAVLLAHHGEVVSSQRLMEAMWPDAMPAKPVGALHNAVCRLRKCLGLDGQDMLRTESSGYRLHIRPDALDALVFEDLLTQARADKQAGPERALQRLERAEALWRGSAFQDVADVLHLQAEAARLDQLRHVAMEERAEVLVALGRTAEALALLEACVAAQPLQERPLGMLMRLLYESGRHVDALHLYENYKHRLAEELGLDPSPYLQKIELEILRHEMPSLTGSGGTAPARIVDRDIVLPPDTFVGRENDIKKIADCLAGRSVTTLVGPGGVGKTRLALHVADKVSHKYPDGVLLCGLGEVSEPGAVPHALAAAARLLPEAMEESSLLQALAGRRSLLVLDNCEHLLQTVSALVGRLLSVPGRIAVLATSREPLAVQGERVYHVEPLRVEPGDGLAGEAVKLFIDRAQAANSRFESDGYDLRSVEELCLRLDGLPLAIELAAARTRTLPVAEMVRRLDDRLTLLSEPRSATPRHRSLWDVVDWSFERLDAEQRKVYPQLAIFPGDFTLDAAAGVVTSGLSPARLTTRVLDLADRSLLDRAAFAGTDEPPRYRLLETLRRYGLERLHEAGTADLVASRHAHWFTAHAERVMRDRSEPGRDWIAELESDIHNFRAAHRRLADSRDIDGLLRLTASLCQLGVATMRAELFEWAQEAVRLATGSGHPLLGAAFVSAGRGAWYHGDLATAEEYARKAMEGSDDPRVLCHGHDLHGDVALHRQRLEDAAAHYRESVRLSGLMGDRWQAAFSSGCLALTLTRLGRLEEARAALEGVRAEARRQESLDLRIAVAILEGELSLALRPREVPEAFWRAARLSRESRNNYLVCTSWIAAASAEAEYGDPQRSAATYRDLLREWSRPRLGIPLAVAMRGVVRLLAKAGRHEDAAILFGALPPAPVASLFTGVNTEFSHVVERLRAGMRPEAFDVSVARGRELTLRETIDFAVALLDRMTRSRSVCP